MLLLYNYNVINPLKRNGTNIIFSNLAPPSHGTNCISITKNN